MPNRRLGAVTTPRSIAPGLGLATANRMRKIDLGDDLRRFAPDWIAHPSCNPSLSPRRAAPDAVTPVRGTWCRVVYRADSTCLRVPA